MTAISHPSRRPFVRSAGALLPLWAAIGCKKHASAGPGQTLTLGLSTDTAIIDSSVTGSSITALITRSVVDSLIGQPEDGRFTPWLAESWEVDEGGARYSFHLRSGVTFSHGASLDAVAVKFNLDCTRRRTHRDLKIETNNSAHYFESSKGISLLDY